MADVLTTAAFLAHLAACTSVHPVIAEAPAQRVMATAMAESGLRVLVINDNTGGRSYRFGTLAEASAKARALVAAGHRIDAGPMQVTDRNWQAYGLDAGTVFDPRLNICAGARILGEAYRIERRASCRYNTGSPDCRRESGSNGYPERVDAALRGLAAAPAPVADPAHAAAPEPPPPAECGPVPPDWDGLAQARNARCVRRARQAPPPSDGGPGAPTTVASNQPQESR